MPSAVNSAHAGPKRIRFHGFASCAKIIHNHDLRGRPLGKPTLSAGLMTNNVLPATGAVPQDRRVLLHYHFFKNAGTSLDAILQLSFGNAWFAQEYPTPRHTDQVEILKAALLANPSICAVSSHTLNFPLPNIPGFSFFPVLFIREPLVRLRSAYDFERRQEADTTGANLAKRSTFAEYLVRRLATPNDRACRDFQTYRLARFLPAVLGPERARALAAIDLLPFVGLVERFDDSIALLQDRVAPLFPAFKSLSVRKNVTTRHETQADILAGIERDLGKALFYTVLEANKGDLAIYEKVKWLYEWQAQASKIETLV